MSKGELPSVRITDPIDIKKLSSRMGVSIELDSNRRTRQSEAQGLLPTYPNVTPEPAMYCPKVLIGPLGPAPYLMMLKLPSFRLSSFSDVLRGRIIV